MPVDSSSYKQKDEYKKYKTGKGIIAGAGMAAGALGQTSHVIKSVVLLIEKAQRGLHFLEKSGVVRSIHLVSGVVAGAALFLNLLKQTLFVFYLKKDQRSKWWEKKSFGGKAAYIGKCLVAIAGIGMAIASIVTSGLTALILVASCYVASSVQNFIGFFRKFPKILDKITSATEERDKLINNINQNDDSSTKELDLEIKNNEIKQLRLDAVSQVGNFVFNGVYVAAAVLLVVAPPIGAIMLGITVLANIGFAAVTGVIGKIFSKKATAPGTDKKALTGENDEEPKEDLQSEKSHSFSYKDLLIKMSSNNKPGNSEKPKANNDSWSDEEEGTTLINESTIDKSQSTDNNISPNKLLENSEKKIEALTTEETFSNDNDSDSDNQFTEKSFS